MQETAMSFHINIGVEAFDGQFFRLAVVSKTGNALTMLEEQKKHWKSVCSKSTSELKMSVLNIGSEDGCIRVFHDAVQKLDFNICVAKKMSNYNVGIHGAIHVGRTSGYALASITINLWTKALIRNVNQRMAKDNEKTMGQTDQHNTVESNENSVAETELPKEDHTKDTDDTEKRHHFVRIPTIG
ncbi:unnamed protein product [Mytilus coruscus]|uniref:Uncharacterized protein n=1 Tax=Mytilus coruscus TaxID=42192 RepID=A0A6J8CGR1_MYTCO|nr:unnamed protein product [Mytilus coruscus]